jgi:CDP-glycerol glycerophosphotransferase
VWNKVYRRSFWIRNNFRFPSHLYEDAPVTVPAHVLASAVDVVTETVYYWRKREGLDLSITQRLTEEANLRGRMCQITSVSEFLRDACPALKPVYERAALEHDVAIMLSALPSIEISLRTELCERLHRFAVRAAPTTARMLSPITKSSFDLLLQRRFDELVEAGRHVKGTEFL